MNDRRTDESVTSTALTHLAALLAQLAVSVAREIVGADVRDTALVDVYEPNSDSNFSESGETLRRGALDRDKAP
jgi:hypothetical protein